MARVLLIDDSPIILEWLRLSLGQAGLEVEIAASGEEGLARLDEVAPDVVVCDLQMPGMSGIDVIRALRERAPLLPALILTEHDNIGLCVSAMREGAIGYVLKGMMDELLLPEVNAALEHRRLRQKNRELEAANLAYQRHLETMVEQKTAEVLRLQRFKAQAEKMASMGTLVAGVAHEVNNPLAVVKSNLHWVEGLAEQLQKHEEALTRAIPDPYLLEDLCTLPEVLSEASHEANRIVRIVQSLHRIAHPRMTASSCSLQEALDEAQMMCGGVLTSEMELVRRLEPDVESVRVAREDLTTVLANLLTNAAQSLPQGQGRIEVSARRLASGNVVVSVSDTGVGIPAEHLERVCDPFFTTREPGGGTGLGLSLVRQVLESAGGQLRIESTVGAGTTIYLELPPAETMDVELTPVDGRLRA